ncbi:MAG: hypothetical protein JNK02_05555 [Planctomycetes bacterium]|nr:hypothetical protein [Planctomycetota bacterium]
MSARAIAARAALVLGVALAAPLVGRLDARPSQDGAAPRPTPAPERAGDAPQDAAAAARLAAAWREALELDLPGEVLASGAWIETRADADPELAALYARALFDAGQAARAASILARGRSAPLILVEARIALERDELARARALLAPEPGAREPVRFPAADECWLLLGRALARADELARAEPLLVEFVRRAPFHAETPQAWFLLVDCARARGDGALALRREESRARSAEWHAYYRARRLQARANPKEPLPRLGLAQLWLSAGELERARAEVTAALELDPRFCRALELAAEIERRAGHVQRATQLAVEALGCDATLVEIHLTRARLARDQGDAQGYAAHLARYRERGGTKDP